MSKPLTVSLVIPVYNEEYHLKRCLDAVTSQSVMPTEIIVVDNNSTDKTVVVARNYPLVRVVTEPTQGVLFASRRGFDEARGDIICRIDADTIMEPDWIEQVGAFFINNPDAAAVTGNCYFYDFPFRHAVQVMHHAVYYSMQKLIAGTEILWGSNMALTSKAWKQVQAECINHSGIHEDIDLSFHLQTHGLDIFRSPELVVGVSLLRGNATPLKLIRYLWPWPSNSLKSYFWSWSRTYWVNHRHLQALAISVMMLSVGLLVFPVSCLLWPLKLLKPSSRLGQPIA